VKIRHRKEFARAYTIIGGYIRPVIQNVHMYVSGTSHLKTNTKYYKCSSPILRVSI